MPDDYEAARDGNLRLEVVSYLTRMGWRVGEPGQVGELWSPVDAESSRLAVPFALGRNSREFHALVARLAVEAFKPAHEVAEEIETEFQDLQLYRIADSFVQDDSVLLDAASTVLTSARKLLRAAATTARKPRPEIGSNFSPPGDEIAERARLSHTRRGSFVLPVVMPMRPPEVVQNQILDSEGQVSIESGERRVTRTLASAIVALDSIAVKPAKEPGADEVMALVQSGVSRELVAAVRSIAADSGIHAFEASFRWAAALPEPGRIPDRVTISDEASGLLGRVEQKLRSGRPKIDQSVSGQIVEIRHLQGERMGEVAIRTIRFNRQVEIRITVRAETVLEAADWFKADRAIIAYGAVESSPGKPLRMKQPRAVRPLDELFIDDATSGP